MGQGASWSEGEPVMWAITDMDAVPPGAMLINPQVGGGREGGGLEGAEMLP